MLASMFPQATHRLQGPPASATNVLSGGAGASPQRQGTHLGLIFIEVQQHSCIIHAQLQRQSVSERLGAPGMVTSMWSGSKSGRLVLLTELLGADSWSGGAGLQWWWAASECHVVRCSLVGVPPSKPEEKEYANANDGTATKDKEEHCDSCGAVVKRQDERPHESAHKAIELKGCKELLSEGTYNERERHGKSVLWLLYYLVVAAAAY